MTKTTTRQMRLKVTKKMIKAPQSLKMVAQAVLLILLLATRLSPKRTNRKNWTELSKPTT